MQLISKRRKNVIVRIPVAISVRVVVTHPSLQDLKEVLIWTVGVPFYMLISAFLYVYNIYKRVYLGYV